jgi:carbon-monoxide dehydrogenase medium subunit
LAHADPASEYPAVAVALGATFEIAAKVGGRVGSEVGGEPVTRSVSADSFFVGTWRTCVEADELLMSVCLPVWEGRCGFAVEEMARRAGDFALAGAACAVGLDAAGAVSRVGIGLFGVGTTPVRAAAAEAALMGQKGRDLTPEPLHEIGELAVAGLDPPDDIHASGRYRRQVAARLTARALSKALAEAARA